MANTKPNDLDTFPRSGKVTEVCKEWTVREDGALAYRLQNQEISEHYQGNRFRNAVVREDFPKALDEQIREQQLAEQAAAVYHQMLAEQEEVDILYARQLTEKLEREEKVKKRALELQDERLAKHLIDSSQRTRLHSSSSRTSDSVISSPRRQALAMPLPNVTTVISHNLNNVSSTDHYLYTEPYKSSNDLANHFDRIEIAEVGLPLDDISEREIQEQKDAQLAQELQQQEISGEQSQLDRDRLLAIEAQDKELAKLLQERERQKAKRARERAKQKALAKKQQVQQTQDIHQIMPDDSYSNPIDLLPLPQNAGKNSTQKYLEVVNTDEDINYSFPADILPTKPHNHNLKQNYDSQYNHDNGLNISEKINNCDTKQPVRPTHLDLKSLNYPSKPRFLDPELSDNKLQHTNIAMAIDPTYNRRSQHSVPYYDTSSSTVTTSTSSNSPGIVLPSPDLPELDEETSPVPPYMPIQGQRRTASLEKKPKKKSKDGCKQQ